MATTYNFEDSCYRCKRVASAIFLMHQSHVRVVSWVCVGEGGWDAAEIHVCALCTKPAEHCAPQNSPLGFIFNQLLQKHGRTVQ